MDINNKEYRQEFQLACETLKMMKQADKKAAAKAHQMEEQLQLAAANETQSFFNLLRAGV